MSVGRTTVALAILVVGAMALLILRYDPWVYATILANPLITVPLVGVAAAVLGNMLVQRVSDPKRAVVFRDERFDRIEPRGAFPLGPGERIGAEIPLDEQLVTGQPITVYDADHKEHLIVLGLTWRLIPSAVRPGEDRERRVLLMSDGERRLIVVQTIERIIRDIARNMTIAELAEALLDPDVIEAIRQGANVRLEDDALTVDRLHVQRIIPKEEKKDEAKPYRETRTVKGSRKVEVEAKPQTPGSDAGRAHEHSTSEDGPHEQRRAGPTPVRAVGAPPEARCAHGYVHGCPYGCAPCCPHGYRQECPFGCQGSVTMNESYERTEEYVRGAEEKNVGAPKPLLKPEDHTRIMLALKQYKAKYKAELDDEVKKCAESRSRGECALFALRDHLMRTSPGDADLLYVTAALRTVRALHEAYPQDPQYLESTVNHLVDELKGNASDVANQLSAKAAATKKQGDAQLAEALELAAKLVRHGAGPIYGDTTSMNPVKRADARHLLRQDVKGALIGAMLGAMLAGAIAKSPPLAAVLAPDQPAITAQDAGVARAAEMSAAALVGS